MTPWDQLYCLKGKVSERSDYSWTLSRSGFLHLLAGDLAEQSQRHGTQQLPDSRAVPGTG